MLCGMHRAIQGGEVKFKLEGCYVLWAGTGGVLAAVWECEAGAAGGGGGGL